MDVRTEADVDAFWAEVNRRVMQNRARRGYMALRDRVMPERELVDPTRDALVAAALGWVGADGVPIGGRSYAALRVAIHDYREAHREHEA